MSVTLKVYGDSFQLGIIKAIVESPVFYSSIREHLTPEYLTINAAKIPYELITAYHRQYKIVPDFSTLEILIKEKLANKEYERDVILVELYKLRMEKVFRNEVFIKEKTLEFCRKQALHKAISNAQDLLNLCDKDPSAQFDINVLSQFTKIKEISLDPIDSSVLNNVDQILAGEIRKNVTSTGHKMFDYVLGGGVASGELHTLAAYTNVGKTLFMRDIGANILAQSKTVLHITTEDSADKVKNGYLSRLTGIPIKKLRLMSGEVKKRMEKYQDKGMELHVKGYPMNAHTVDKLESYIIKLRDNGVKIDVMIIDSPLHLLSYNKGDNDRTKIGNVWKSCRGMMQQYEIAGLATAQLNRGSANRHGNGTEDIGEAIAISQDSDSLTTINRKNSDLLTKTAQLRSAKTREATPGETWTVYIEAEISKIREDDEAVSKRIIELESQKIKAIVGEEPELNKGE